MGAGVEFATDRCEGLPYGRISIFKSNTEFLLLANGVRGVADALAYDVGYNTDVRGSQPRANPLSEQSYDRVAALMRLLPAGDVTRILCVGHSAGAVNALWSGYRLWNANPSWQPRFMAFCSPRVGNAALGQAMSRFEMARWMFDDDLIPYVPPRATEAPALWLASRLDRPWSGYFEHLSGAWEIRRNGSLRPNNLPSEIFLPLDTQAVQNLYFCGLTTGFRHTTGQLVAALRQYATDPEYVNAPAPRGADPFAGVQFGPDRQPLPVPNVRQLEADAAAGSQALPRNNVKSKPFTVVVKERRFLVACNGTPICQLQKRKQASKLARDLNRSYAGWWSAFYPDVQSWFQTVNPVFGATPRSE